MNHCSKSLFSLYVLLLEASLLQKQMIHYITLKSIKSFCIFDLLRFCFHFGRVWSHFCSQFWSLSWSQGLQSFLPSNVSLRSGCLSIKVVLLPELRSLRVLSLSLLEFDSFAKNNWQFKTVKILEHFSHCSQSITWFSVYFIQFVNITVGKLSFSHWVACQHGMANKLASFWYYWNKLDRNAIANG